MPSTSTVIGGAGDGAGRGSGLGSWSALRASKCGTISRIGGRQAHSVAPLGTDRRRAMLTRTIASAPSKSLYIITGYTTAHATAGGSAFLLSALRLGQLRRCACETPERRLVSHKLLQVFRVRGNVSRPARLHAGEPPRARLGSHGWRAWPRE